MRISDWSSDVCSSDLQDYYFPVIAWHYVHPLRFPPVSAPLVLSRCPTWPLRLLTPDGHRSEEHTSELQSLMRILYAVFCLKKKKKKNNHTQQCCQKMLSIHVKI